MQRRKSISLLSLSDRPPSRPVTRHGSGQERSCQNGLLLGLLLVQNASFLRPRALLSTGGWRCSKTPEQHHPIIPPSHQTHRGWPSPWGKVVHCGVRQVSVCSCHSVSVSFLQITAIVFKVLQHETFTHSVGELEYNNHYFFLNLINFVFGMFNTVICETCQYHIRTFSEPASSLSETNELNYVGKMLFREVILETLLQISKSPVNVFISLCTKKKQRMNSVFKNS